MKLLGVLDNFLFLLTSVTFSKLFVNGTLSSRSTFEISGSLFNNAPIGPAFTFIVKFTMV